MYSFWSVLCLSEQSMGSFAQFQKLNVVIIADILRFAQDREASHFPHHNKFRYQYNDACYDADFYE